MNRRQFLHSACALAVAASFDSDAAHAQGQRLRFADMHTYIGMYRDTQNVRNTMMKNGVLLAARKIFSDGAVIRNIPGKGFQMFREPAPGELFKRYEAALERLKSQHKNENLVEIASAEALQRAVSAGEPAVVICVEGGEFLEGDIKRLESARQQSIVHLQLVRYRVSELGDISTERPLHNGLTSFSKDVGLHATGWASWSTWRMARLT